MKQILHTVKWSALGPGLFILACGGGGAQNTSNASQGVSNKAPGWVMRGNVVENGSVYGVGSVSGVRNPALARSTAGNRARNEVAKVLEVYSASLMKDYSASTTAGDMSASSEEQRVEQAIKTFTAQLLTGVEVNDYWIEGPVLFAQAELNFARAKEIALAKEQMGDSPLKDWLDKNGDRLLDDLEGDMRQGPPPPPPPAPRPPEPEEIPPGVDPDDDTPQEGPPVQTGGGTPAWKDGQCQSGFLCGIGSGVDYFAADSNARAELARIFESNIAAVTKTFDSASQEISSKTGERWVEVSQVSQYSMVTTNRVVTMSTISDRWKEDEGRFWSLAVIDRRQASRALSEQIQQKDGDVAGNLQQAQGARDKLARLRAVKRAVSAHAAREAMNADLQVINEDGRGIPPPHQLADLLALLDEAAGELQLGLAVSGQGAEQIRDCIETAMQDRGYQITANIDEQASGDIDVSGNFDVLIKGKVKSEKRGKRRGNQTVKVTVTLKLINPKTNKVLRTITQSKKGTRRSVEAAISTAATQICTKKVRLMVSDIDRYFGK